MWDAVTYSDFNRNCYGHGHCNGERNSHTDSNYNSNAIRQSDRNSNAKRKRYTSGADS